MNTEPVPCDSRITNAVVYARGAVVSRRVALPEALPEDSLSLRVTGVSPLAQPGSFRTRVSGSREVIGLRSELRLPEVTTFGGPVLEKLIELGRVRKTLEAREAAAHERHRVLSSISLKLGMRRKMRWHDPSRRIRDTLAISTLIDSRLTSVDDELLAIHRDLEENTKALAEAEAEAARARATELAGAEIPTRDVTIVLDNGGVLDDLFLTYNVRAARWWPAYSVRLTEAGRRADLTIEAFVAQDTFEDWTDISIGLCTADLMRDVRLPELPSLRLGRAQPAKRRGFRPPPRGLERMFAGYDQAMSQAEKRMAAATEREALDDVLDSAEEQSLYFNAADLGATPPVEAAPLAEQEAPLRRPKTMGISVDMLDEGRGVPEPGAYQSPARQAMPQAPLAESKGGLASNLAGAVLGPAVAAAEAVRSGRKRSKKKGHEAHRALVGGAVGSDEIAPADHWLDFDHLHLVAPKSRIQRGQLKRRRAEALGDRVRSAVSGIDNLDAPRQAVDPRGSSGEFDYRYDAQASVDVPSDGVVHRVTLANAESDADTTFRSVPRMAEEVYREVALTNPFDGPLLSGPADIFLDGALITTSKIDSVDRGGRVRFGLGQEERLRIARNTQIDESSHGLLGGSTHVDHTVTIEIASALGSESSVEVVDRLPVTDDEDVEITLRSATPKPEDYDQSERGKPLRNGKLWRLAVPAGGKSTLTYQYRIELPSKCELIGGNRRE